MPNIIICIYVCLYIFRCSSISRHIFRCIVTLLGKELLTVPSVRDLGMQVDATLNYDEHITKTVSACITCLSQIS